MVKLSRIVPIRKYDEEPLLSIRQELQEKLEALYEQYNDLLIQLQEGTDATLQAPLRISNNEIKHLSQLQLDNRSSYEAAAFNLRGDEKRSKLKTPETLSLGPFILETKEFLEEMPEKDKKKSAIRMPNKLPYIKNELIIADGKWEIDELTLNAQGKVIDIAGLKQSQLDKLNNSLIAREKIHVTITDEIKKKLSINLADTSIYQEYDFILNAKEDRESLQKLQGNTTLHDIEITHNLRNKTQNVGTIPSITLNKNGEVIDIEVPSQKSLDVVKDYLFSNEITNENQQNIAKVTKTIIEYLKNNDDAQKAYFKYTTSPEKPDPNEKKGRGWPLKMAKDLQERYDLAYYSEKVLPFSQLGEWVKEGKFSWDDLYNAGVVERTLSGNGEVNYSPYLNESILIPYKNEVGKIVDFNARVLEPGDGPKYMKSKRGRELKFPDDLEIQVMKELYQANLANSGDYERIIIMEGEFKVNVVQPEYDNEKTLFVSIPGITQMTENIYDFLAGLNAKEFIVSLDKDPGSRAMLRANGASDAEVASYKIAKNLQDRKKNTKIAELSSSEKLYEDIKLGQDEIYFSHGGKAQLDKIFTTAISVDEFKIKYQIDPLYEQIKEVQGSLFNALSKYKNTLLRSGFDADEDQTLIDSRDLLIKVKEIKQEYEGEVIDGSRSIMSPASRFAKLHMQSIPLSDEYEGKKFVKTANGGLPIDAFSSAMNIFNFAPSDIRDDELSNFRDFQKLPFSKAEMLEKIKIIQSRKENLPPDDRFQELMQKGAEAFGESLDKGKRGKITLEIASQYIIAGVLREEGFPMDEYKFVRDLEFYNHYGDHKELAASLPLAVVRKAYGTIEAVATSLMQVNDRKIGKATEEYHGWDNAYRSFKEWARPDIRSNGLSHGEELLHEVLFSEERVQRQMPVTLEKLKQYGFTEEDIIDKGIVRFTQEDVESLTKLHRKNISDWLQNFADLKDELSHKRLTGVAERVGLLVRDKSNKVKPAFTGDVVLIPTKNQKGKIISIRAMAENRIDFDANRVHGDDQQQSPGRSHINDAPIRHLSPPGRRMGKHANPNNHLYLEENLPRISQQDNKEIIIAQNEIEALAINKKASENQAVLGANSSLNLTDQQIITILDSKPQTLTFVISKPPPPSKFDDFSGDGTPSYIKDLMQLRDRIKHATNGKLNNSYYQMPEIKIVKLEYPAYAQIRDNYIDVQETINKAPSLKYIKKQQLNDGNLYIQETEFLKSMDKFIKGLETKPDLTGEEAKINKIHLQDVADKMRLTYNNIRNIMYSEYGEALPDLKTYFLEKFPASSRLEPVDPEDLLNNKSYELTPTYIPSAVRTGKAAALATLPTKDPRNKSYYSRQNDLGKNKIRLEHKHEDQFDIFVDNPELSLSGLKKLANFIEGSKQKTQDERALFRNNEDPIEAGVKIIKIPNKNVLENSVLQEIEEEEVIQSIKVPPRAMLERIGMSNIRGLRGNTKSRQADRLEAWIEEEEKKLNVLIKTEQGNSTAMIQRESEHSRITKVRFQRGEQFAEAQIVADISESPHLQRGEAYDKLLEEVKRKFPTLVKMHEANQTNEKVIAAREGLQKLKSFYSFNIENYPPPSQYMLMKKYLNDIGAYTNERDFKPGALKPQREGNEVTKHASIWVTLLPNSPLNSNGKKEIIKLSNVINFNNPQDMPVPRFFEDRPEYMHESQLDLLAEKLLLLFEERLEAKMLKQRMA